MFELNVKCKKCKSKLRMTIANNVYCKKCNERIPIDEKVKVQKQKYFKTKHRVTAMEQILRADRDKELPLKFPHIFK